jgi:hypothetical protein
MVWLSCWVHLLPSQNKIIVPSPTAQAWLRSLAQTPNRSFVVPLACAVQTLPFH